MKLTNHNQHMPLRAAYTFFPHNPTYTAYFIGKLYESDLLIPAQALKLGPVSP